MGTKIEFGWGEGLFVSLSLLSSIGLTYHLTHTDEALERQRQEYREDFDRLDLNKDGVLSFEEYLPNRLK